MSARAIPSSLPRVLAEIETPQWDHPVGSVPMIVDGRVFLWGATGAGLAREFGLFEIDRDWNLAERIRLPNDSGNVAASRVLAVDGGFGFAWSSVEHFALAHVVDPDFQRIAGASFAATGRGVDFTTRVSAGGLAVGWTGERARGVASLDHHDRRWSLEGASLLAAIGDVVIVGRDEQHHHAGLRALDAMNANERWRSEADKQGELVRGGVGANEHTFFLVEQETRSGIHDHLRAIDPLTGRDRWKTDFQLRVSSIRATGPVVAIALRGPGGRAHSRVFESETGALLSGTTREGVSGFEVIAADHTHVLYHDANMLLCERHSGEEVWRLRLPDEFRYANALRIVCGDGWIVLRHDAKTWIFGE